MSRPWRGRLRRRKHKQHEGVSSDVDAARAAAVTAILLLGAVIALGMYFRGHPTQEKAPATLSDRRG